MNTLIADNTGRQAGLRQLAHKIGGALLVSIALARGSLLGAENVLAPGDPPLTQDVLDRATRFQSWVLDIDFSQAGWQQYQRLVFEEWKDLPAKSRNEFIQEAQAWANLLKQPEAKRRDIRAQVLPSVLAQLRSDSTWEKDKLLLACYEEAHRVLVDGQVPLTQKIVWQQTSRLEWLLDVTLTQAQRQQDQNLLMGDWKAMDSPTRERFVSNLEREGQELARLNGQSRHWRHAQQQPPFLAVLRRATNDASAIWALALYDAAHKPGGERNPVLVPGDPPLTGEMADEYCDYLENVLDLSLIGGLNAQQRKAYQEFLIKDWKKKDRADKEVFLALLSQFNSVHLLGKAEATAYFSAECPRFMAQMESAGNDAGCRFLHAIYQQAQQAFHQAEENIRRQAAVEQELHGVTMDMIHNMGSSSYDRYHRW